MKISVAGLLKTEVKSKVFNRNTGSAFNELGEYVKREFFKVASAFKNGNVLRVTNTLLILNPELDNRIFKVDPGSTRAETPLSGVVIVTSMYADLFGYVIV